MYIDVPFTKENVELSLKEIAKELKKRYRGAEAEIILVGGASIIVNYSFRHSSYDIDAMYSAPSIMKEVINAVGDRQGLPNGWLNDDFKKTASYSDKIVQYSEYYKTFSNVLSVRTVRAEYLIAMKLVSGRQYKKDLSDIAGIVYEQSLLGKPITYEMIDTAVKNLYGNWDKISDASRETLKKILSYEDLQALFAELNEDEEKAKSVLGEISKKYPQAVNKDNVEEIIKIALEKKNKK